MEIRFDGKRVLVTGAGKGFGRSIAKALVACGAETYAVSRTQSDLDSLSTEVPGVRTVLLDLSQWNETREVISKLGQFDLLVNNAGIGSNTPFFDVQEEEIDKIFAGNYKSLVNVSQVVCAGMRDSGRGGVVVNMSSQASYTASYGLAAYASSKAAIDMVTKSMALELGPHKIRVNSVNPTVALDTEMGRHFWKDSQKADALLSRMSLGRFAVTADVTNMVLFLLSDKSGITHAQNIHMDSGYY